MHEAKPPDAGICFAYAQGELHKEESLSPTFFSD
jgi:hypothetical protein